MITYKQFVELMEGRGYHHNGIETIDESYPYIKTFSVKKGSVGKILELSCPEDTIISICGKNHLGGCEKSYVYKVRCFNNNDKQPFQGLHHATKLTDKHHIVAEIVASKILQKHPNTIDANYKEWLTKTTPILKLVGSENPYEHIMWVGAYELFSRDILNESLNIYGNENMILYAIKPDVDISKVKFEIKADILKKSS